jgi:hypothetical protein
LKFVGVVIPIVVGLKIPEAAAAVGVSEVHFRKMQRKGRMPRPRSVGGVPIIDVAELEQAFRALPHEGVEAALDEAWSGATP